MAKDKEIEYKTPEDVAEEKARKKASKAYDEAMPEPDTTFGKLGRKALGAMAAPAGAIVGGAYLGTQPGSPGVIDSAKYGAKGMYHAMTGNKKAIAEAEQEFKDATKRAQSVKTKRDEGETTNAMGDKYARGGMTASRRADGIATKGKTRGTMVAMCGGGMYKK
jgi:hypothetical protein